jgi:hypothetical protein
MARPLPKSTVTLKEVKETEVPSGDSNDSKEQTTALQTHKQDKCIPFPNL